MILLGLLPGCGVERILCEIIYFHFSFSVTLNVSCRPHPSHPTHIECSIRQHVPTSFNLIGNFFIDLSCDRQKPPIPAPRHPPASRLFVVSFTCSIDLFEVKRKTHFLAFAKCAQSVRRALINIERSIFTIHAQMNSSEHSELI